MTAPGGPPPGILPLPLPRAARARPGHPAVVGADGASVDYAGLAAWSDGLARRLATAGVTVGDRVALVADDGARFAALAHAVARLGATLVPLNTRLTAAEIGWQVADAAPRLVVAEPHLADRVAAPTAWDALAALPPSNAPLLDGVPLDAPATVIYTSGTTGRPKGAILTFGNHAWSAAASALRLGALPDDRWLAPLPLFHVGGLAVLWRAALAASTALLPGRFDALAVAGAIAAQDVTLVSLVPTMLARVLDAWGDRGPPARLRAVLLGGGPAAPALLARAVRRGFPVALTYGLTEAASQVATDWPRRDPAAVDGGAPPLPFTDLRVVDAEGAPLPPGVDGAIEVRGPTVMAGYWRAPEATARVLAGGWLATGDVGRLDDAGRLHVRGRRDDLIVSGGENVYPAEVEAVLAGHPRVGACCVVGIPDPDWGEVVAAAVVHAPGMAGAQGPPEGDLEAEIVDHLRRHLAGYKLPRRFVWLEALPATAAGKVRRDAVRRLVIASADRP